MPAFAQAPHGAFIASNCAGCHNARVQSGGVALDGAPDAATWERAVRKMPPLGMPRPAEAACIAG
jgi:mono/diheme cytochrome c family protein